MCQHFSDIQTTPNLLSLNQHTTDATTGSCKTPNTQPALFYSGLRHKATCLPTLLFHTMMVHPSSIQKCKYELHTQILDVFQLLATNPTKKPADMKMGRCFPFPCLWVIPKMVRSLPSLSLWKFFWYFLSEFCRFITILGGPDLLCSQHQASDTSCRLQNDASTVWQY